MPLPSETTLPWTLLDPGAGPWAQKPKQEAGDGGGASVGGTRPPGIAF